MPEFIANLFSLLLLNYLINLCLFDSAKFVSKVKLAYTLEDVNKVLPMQNVPIPDKVRM